MDNQHQKITGYRDLTQEEIDLMNEIKAAEARILALHTRVQDRLRTQAESTSDEAKRIDAAQAYRWSSIARTDLETGFMALVRAVAQPQPKKA